MTEVERAARKLAPLMPRQVARWMKLRDLVDSETRDLIEKRILLTSQRLLGDYKTRLLPSLPAESRIKGEFNLGTVMYETARWPVGLSRAELLQNLCVFGRSGSGKTNFVFHLLHQLTRAGIPFLFLDWKRTARHLLPHLPSKVNVYTPGRSLAPFGFNPFLAPPGMERRAYLRLVLDVLAEAFTLGDGARYVIERACDVCVELSVELSPETLLETVKKLEVRQREHGWKLTALRALESLKRSDITPLGEQAAVMTSLTQSSTVVELDTLASGARRFLIPLLCLWVYRAQLVSTRRERLSLVLVVEEAHHVLYGEGTRARESIMEMLLRQCRELGIAMIVVDQHPHLLSSAALGNCYTSVCLNQRDPRDVSRAAALSLLDREDESHLSRLPVGQAIVKLQGRWTEPFLVQIPQVPPTSEQKGRVDDAALAEYVRGSRSDSGQFRLHTRSADQSPQIPLPDLVHDVRASALLGDVRTHPDSSVTERYARLGWSRATGQRLKDRLVSQGWLEVAIVPCGQSRRAVLRLSRFASDLLGAGFGAGRESLAHEYWKRWHAQRLANAGWTVQVESPRVGGRVDIDGRRDGVRLAVEIETGKSDARQNLRACLASGFDRVVVVATDAKARDSLREVLGSAGLLVSGRVELVLGDAVSYQ